MSLHTTALPSTGFGERSFALPRIPVIRIWALKEAYPDGLYINSVDDNPDNPKTPCFSRGRDITVPLKFVLDDGPQGTGNWSTAPIGDFDLIRVEKGEPERVAFIHIGPTKEQKDSLFTIYVTTSGTTVTTKFGRYAGSKTIPQPFEQNSENYFTDMSDAEGNWLWLYRLYATHHQK